jgi:hypothetical protein
VTDQQLMSILEDYFEREGWHIERFPLKVEAVMPSGYGSGPAVVNLTSLCSTILLPGRKP